MPRTPAPRTAANNRIAPRCARLRRAERAATGEVVIGTIGSDVTKKVISQLESMGAMPTYESTVDFKAFLKKDAGRWDELIKRRNLKLEN